MRRDLRHTKDDVRNRIVLYGHTPTISMMLELFDCEREAYKERALKVPVSELERLQGAVAGIERLRDILLNKGSGNGNVI